MRIVVVNDEPADFLRQHYEMLQFMQTLVIDTDAIKKLEQRGF